MTLFETWGTTLRDSFSGIGIGVVDFLLVQFIPALVVFLVGWLIAVVVGKGIAQLIDSVKLDKFLKNTSLDNMITKAGFTLNSGGFIGGLVKWFIIIAVLVASLDIIGLTDVNVFLSGVILPFLPSVIVAAFVLLIGAVLSDVMQKIVTGSVRAAGIKSANFLGSVTKWIIWVFAILIALSQLGIGQDLLRILFQGFIYMVAIAGGLAFGLGGKEAAAKAIQRLKDGVSDSDKR